MRIVLTWVVGTFLIALIIVSWYITQPLLIQTTLVADMVLDELGTNTTGWEQTKTLNIYVANLWPVPFVLIIFLWMMISSQRTDPESVMYQ